MNACLNCQERCRGIYCMSRACRAAKQRHDRRARNPEPTPQPCDNCGEPTTVAGPQSERRYCMKRDCRAAKQRWDYHQRQVDSGPRRIEDRPCFNCEARMEARPWRSTDLEYGRWCRRSECQKNRLYIEGRRRSDYRYWFEELKPLECEKCGMTKGVRNGFAHPDFQNKRWCTELGELKPDGFLAEFASAEWAEERERLLTV